MSEYSPPIEMWLELCGHHVPVSEVGPDFVAGRSSHSIAPTDAILHICIDGKDTQTRVYLPDGLTKERAEHRVKVFGTVATP